jgi:hypothetical protein
MARDAKSFARKTAKFKAQPRTLVICEDTKSCLDYLKQAARHFRAYAEIEIAHCGRTDPLGIVGEAVKRRGHFDDVFCAIDRDGHQRFNDAIQLAAAKGIEVIASYPSYEFWLLIHFRRTRASFMAAGTQSAADRLVSALRQEPGMGQYAKGESRDLFNLLLPRLPVARQYAPQIFAEAVADNEMNPSTGLHLLIDHFEALSSPRPI